MSAVIGAEAVVIIIAHNKKKIKDAGAVSEETAKTPEELGLDKEWLRTSGHVGVKVTKDGRYYLSEKKPKLKKHQP